MLDAENDAADVKISPPLLYLGGIVAGVLVHAFAFELPIALPMGARIAAAGVTGLAGLALVAAAGLQFRHSGQDPRPWKTTPAIVSRGAFRWSRNPMYVGMALLQAAVGLSLANGWILVLIPVVLVAVHYLVVRHEEIYLERKFAQEYARYKASVRRWI